MRLKDILFSDYLPDRNALPWERDSGYLIVAENVRPSDGGYQTMPLDELTASSATLGATPVSAAGFSVVTAARHYAASATDIYESLDEGATWLNNSKAAYTSSTFWDFALFEDHVIAVNGLDVPQYKLITAAIADNFADLPGSPPIAARVARVRDHVVLGALSSNAYAVQWSDIGNPQSWSTPGSAAALAAQAGLQELPRELGIVTQIVGGEKGGLIFQLSGITRMTYVGGNVVYQFDTFDRAHGTGYKKSAIRVGELVYFASKIGIFRTDGFAVQNLSKNKVEDSIINDVTALVEGADSFGQSVAYDSRYNVVIWPYTAAGSAYLLCYHIAIDRFTVVNLAGTMIGSTLYAVRNGASNDLSKTIPFAFNTTPKLISFTDQTAIQVVLRTGFVELHPGAVTMVTGIQPLGSGASWSSGISLAVKSLKDMTLISTTPTGLVGTSVPLRSDIFKVRKSGRYHSFYLSNILGADALIRGVRVHYEVASRL